MFFQRIKELRKEKGLTQKEISKFLGFSDRTVGYYETGQRTPPPDILEKLADYFGVSVDYLLGRTDINNAWSEEAGTTFAKRLKNLRISKGVTQEEISLVVGVPCHTISAYECGDKFPDYKTLLKIVDYFDTSLDYLLGRVKTNVFTLAGSRTDDYDDELPEQAKKELGSFKDYLRLKYGNKNKD